MKNIDEYYIDNENWVFFETKTNNGLYCYNKYVLIIIILASQ